MKNHTIAYYPWRPLNSKLSGPQSQFEHEEKDPYPCWELQLAHPLHNLSLY